MNTTLIAKVKIQEITKNKYQLTNKPKNPSFKHSPEGDLCLIFKRLFFCPAIGGMVFVICTLEFQVHIRVMRF